MKRLRITSILISLLMLCSCSAGTEQSAPGTAEAAGGAGSAEPAPLAETSDSAEATTPAGASPAEASAEAPSAEPTATPEPERDFTEFFAPPDTSAHADYGERYCDWKYDSSMLISTEEEFLRRGGSESWLNAGRSAVRGTEEFRAVETQSAEMWLYTDGNYYYKKQSGDEEIVTSRFSLSNGYFDEDVKPLVLFDSAAVGDFDGDGATEAFIMFEFPSFSWLNYTENAAVFVNSAGQAEVVSTGVGGYLAPIRYRDFVHMGVSFGVNNISHHAEIFAVENGSAVQKHSAFSLGSKYGLCMLESAAQVPGSWLVIWDNIEKQYRELAHEPAPEGLAAAIYSSPLSEQLEDMTELKDSIAVIGGKYVCIGTAWNSVTLEHDNGRLTVADEHLISSASETEPDYSVYLPAAEELAVPAPIPADRAEYGEYTLTGEGIYTSEEEFRAAEGDFLCDVARKAVLETQQYKGISYQFANAQQFAGDGFTFTHLDQNGEGYTESLSYGDQLTLYEDGSVKPQFLAAACADFDEDGKKEAFVVFRLPYTVSYDIYGESGGISVAVYAASDGTGRALPDWELVRSWGGSPEFTLIRYENEIHLYNADNSAIMGLRGGVPKRLATCDPDGDGRYFSGTMFYHPALGEYSYEKLQPMSGELLTQLVESPAYQEYLSLHPDNVPEYAWINAGGYIITDHYGEYRWDGESFTKTTGARGGGWWISRKINGTYLCF
ncbi:MAG: hypothetical protein ACI4RK_01955 [Oscillospiraceae bacterium]